MVRKIALAAIAVSFASAALAEDVVAGWSRQPDGTYVNVASGIHCAAVIADYAFKGLDGPTAPNIDGVCVYAKESGESGLLRIRHYIKGAGETPFAIKNDALLMREREAGNHDLLNAVRGPGPVVDGVQTYQVMFTFFVKDFLVDCIARHNAPAIPSSEFPLACQEAAGG